MSRTAKVIVKLAALAIVIAVPIGLLAQIDGGKPGEGKPDENGPGGRVVQSRPDPPAPRTIELLEATWPTAGVRAFYTNNGIKPTPLFTQWYCCPGDRKRNEFRFDEKLFRTRLYSPDRPTRRCECQTDRVAGIPPGWSSWVVLDLERPVWAALKDCSADERKRAESFNTFMQVIDAIRLARPGIRLALYGLPLNDEGPCVELERRILARVDASVPPLFQNTRRYRERAFHRRWLGRHLEYKRSRPGFKVFPIIWKSWMNRPWIAAVDLVNQTNTAKIPEIVARRHIEWLLDFEVDGTRIDGVLIFCNLASRDEATDLEFARILVEEVARRTNPPDDPG